MGLFFGTTGHPTDFGPHRLTRSMTRSRNFWVCCLVLRDRTTRDCLRSSRSLKSLKLLGFSPSAVLALGL
jgi:hypothetical protein